MRNPYFLLHLAVLLAGFTGVFGKLISLNEGLLTWYRVLIASVALYLVLKFTKITTRITSKEKFNIAKVGILLTIHWLFFYGSIKYANVSIGVVCYALTSCFTALLAPLINRKKFIISEIVLSLLTVLGISLIFHFDSTYQTGILLGVISSAFAALYTIFNEKLVNKYPSKIINFYQISGGTLALTFLLPIYLYFFPTNYLFPSLQDWFYLLILALVCTVGLYWLFAEALKNISAFTVNLTFNLEPIYSIILAFVFFKEGQEVNFYFYIGLTFVIISVILQSIITARKRKINTI